MLGVSVAKIAQPG